jgi:hypothetical protein
MKVETCSGFIKNKKGVLHFAIFSQEGSQLNTLRFATAKGAAGLT